MLGDGKFSEIMRRYPESKSSVVSFKVGTMRLGGILMKSLVWPLSDMGQFKVLFWIATLLSFTPLFPTLLGWIPEMKRSKDEAGMVAVCGNCLLFDKGKFQSRRVPFLLIILCGLSSPPLVAITTYVSVRIGLSFAAVIIISFCGATYFIFPKSVSKSLGCGPTSSMLYD